MGKASSSPSAGSSIFMCSYLNPNTPGEEPQGRPRTTLAHIASLKSNTPPSLSGGESGGLAAGGPGGGAGAPGGPGWGLRGGIAAGGLGGVRALPGRSNGGPPGGLAVFEVSVAGGSPGGPGWVSSAGAGENGGLASVLDWEPRDWFSPRVSWWDGGPSDSSVCGLAGGWPGQDEGIPPCGQLFHIIIISFCE